MALESKLQTALLADGVNRDGGTNRRAGASPLLHLRFRLSCVRRGPKQGEGVGVDVHGDDLELEGLRQGGCCPPPARMLLADQADFVTAMLEVLVVVLPNGAVRNAVQAVGVVGHLVQHGFDDLLYRAPQVFGAEVDLGVGLVEGQGPV